MNFLQGLTDTGIFKSGATLTENVLNFFSYLISLFIQNPLYFLGGLVLLRISQQGVDFRLKDFLKLDID